MKKITLLGQPFLLLVTPLVVLFRNNPGEIFIFDFLVIIGCLFSVLFALFYLVSKWTKDQEKTAISMSILCLPLILSSEFSSRFTTFIWCACFLGFIISLKLSFPFRWKSALSCSLSIPLLMIIFYNLFELACAHKNIQAEIAHYKSVALPKKLGSETCQKDIYLIILDEFISENSFKNYYHFDNDHFFDSLRNKHFNIISASTSNYPWTITSISSILNFDYHHTVLSKNEFTAVAQVLIEQNQLFQILKTEGYEIHHVPSIYWMGNPVQGPVSDLQSRAKSYGLVQAVSQITPWKNTYRTYQRNAHREHVLYQLDQLKGICIKPGKKLAFAHIMCPHRPIAFNENGGPLSKEEIMRAEKDPDHYFYLAQAKFISNEVLKLVDYILEHSEQPPLIIILSDHGKFPVGCSPKGKLTLPLNEIAWRFSNLQALYLPDFNAPIPEHITPLNTVRMILNHYFGYNLPILENACCPHFYDFTQRISSQSILDNLQPFNDCVTQAASAL